MSNTNAGTYTITYDIDDGNGCLNSSTFDVTIGTSTVGFDYGGQTSFCLGSTCPGVNYTTTTGGVFSSNSSDLIVDPSTGEIDLVNSQPGNYEITYNVSSVNQLGTDFSDNTLMLLSGWNGVSMNNFGTRVAIGYPYFDNWNLGSDGCVKVFDWNGSSWNQVGNNIKSGRGYGRTGTTLSLSEDGNTLAVITPRNSYKFSWSLRGTLKMFEWDGSNWVSKGSTITCQLGRKEDNFSLDINDDGTVVAVGEYRDYTNSSVTEGRVTVYEWDGSSWNVKGAVLVGENLGDQFGFSISLNATGNRIAVGAPNNDGNKGEVKLYEWTNSAWNVIEEFNGASATKLGHAVSLNSNGNQIAISESDYNSNAGAVSIFTEGTNSWNLAGNIIEGTSSGDKFGHKVKLNSDGSRFLASSRIGSGYSKL